MQDRTNEFWEDEPERRIRIRRNSRLSIKAIMIVTAVMAASAVSLGHLWRAAQSDGNGMEIGQFVVITAMMPTLFLVAASWFVRIFGRWLD